MVNESIMNVGNHTVSGEPRLDLSSWPPIFVSSTHFDTDELHELEEDLIISGATITYDIHEARVILSKVLRKARILFDLRAKGLHARPVSTEVISSRNSSVIVTGRSMPIGAKRKRQNSTDASRKEPDVIEIHDSSTESEPESISRGLLTDQGANTNDVSDIVKRPSSIVGAEHACSNFFRVVRVDWFIDSAKLHEVQPLDNYTTFIGRPYEPNTQDQTVPTASASPQERVWRAIPHTTYQAIRTEGDSILKRAKEDFSKSTSQWAGFKSRRFGQSNSSSGTASWESRPKGTSKYAHLLHRTTTEHDDGFSSEIPDMPEWVRNRVRYSCLRSTQKDSPNSEFIALLKEIQQARTLTADEIGVRAYATSIASIAAYPYRIRNPREILALPGCEVKIANLFVEWTNTGVLKAVEDIEGDQDLKVLRLFYDIWGVGATTARDFYYNKGWQDLDDIVEFGWSTLTRVQQIGVKFYDEFLDLIPRAEVEDISRIITEHAVKVRDSGIQTMIVGGYRRGKQASGDVDVIVSHPDEAQTMNLVTDIVTSLEEEEWITHTLLISLNNTNRDQQTLPFRGVRGGHGFDTLDKALVVWQDPNWPTKDRDLAEDPKAKNPNIHRRVDIIVSPWRTVGCAVVGWSGGTTFERDLRSYARSRKGWKFDSSGVRDRANGEVVDLEGYHSWRTQDGKDGRAKTMEEAEKRVFQGLDIPYREPWERWTG